MADLIEVIHNVETGEIVERKLTAAQATAFEASRENVGSAAAAIAAARQSALAKLAELGLTEEEIAAL